MAALPFRSRPPRPVAPAPADAVGLPMEVLALLITVGTVMSPNAAIGGVVWRSFCAGGVDLATVDHRHKAGIYSFPPLDRSRA